MPPVAKITAPGPRQRRPGPRVLGCRPPDVAAGPADPADQLDVPTQLCGNDIRPDPRIVGGQPAGRPVVGQRVAEDQQCRPRPPDSEDIVGDLCRGVPHVEPPPDAVEVVGAGVVVECPDSCTQLALPMPPSTGQLSTGSSAAPRSARRSARRAPPAPPAARARRRPIRSAPATSSATNGRLRAATSTRLSPPCGAHRGVVAPRQPRAGRRGVDLECGSSPASRRGASRAAGCRPRTGSPVRSPSATAVSSARRRSDDTISSGCRLASTSAAATAWSRPEVGQLGVELALHPAARVELGLPVPQHHQAADPHGRSRVAPSRSTGTTGQSRHNRSSA